MLSTLLPQVRHFAAVIVACLILAGCSGADIDDTKSGGKRNPLAAEVPTPDETVRGEEDPPIVTLELGSTLQEHKLSGGDDLPGKIMIPSTNLNAVPITAALQGVLAGTDVSLSWNTGDLGDRLVTVINLSGPLPRVVDKICTAAKVFCVYRNGTLELQEEDTFVMSIPPAVKASTGGSNSMVEAIKTLVSGKVQVDDQGGNIIYTTDVEGQQRVKQYLNQLRNGRPLVVLQVYIWEVTLNKSNGEGINWKAFTTETTGSLLGKTSLYGPASSFTSLASTTGNMGLGAVTSGKIQVDALLSFLSTQGRVQNISSPQLTFVSGSSANLKIGGTQRYISQVGASTNTASGSTNTSTSNNTVSTDSIDTGLSVDADGVYENGVVFANLKIVLRNVISLNPTTTGSQTINLPETADETVSTSIRVRPGDNLVMAGLVSSTDNSAREGIPFGSGRIPTLGKDEVENRELVIVIKPSVVLFSDKIAVAEEKKKNEANHTDAVVIDKDGAKTLKIEPIAEPKLPEKSSAMFGSTLPAQQPDMFLSPASNSAVDRRLLQRGFSNAFDAMSQNKDKGSN